jgi:5'-phosphate synthase pdxT subunit
VHAANVAAAFSAAPPQRKGVNAVKIGILAVQGDFDAHRAMLARLGAETVLVKTPRDLAGLDGLVLPGGESTTHLKFLLDEGLFEPIRRMGLAGRTIFGTCAGAILLAREVRSPAQASLALVDMVIERNAYGRQVASEVCAGESSLWGEPLEMVYIRAPVIREVGPGVEVLARREDAPVLVRQGKILAATFHPELTSDSTVHELFLKMAGGETRGAAQRARARSGAKPADRAPNDPPSAGAAGDPPPARSKRERVLFVCVGNSCRSQIAEAFARHLAGDVIEPMSAGISPLGEIAATTRRVLAERGISTDGQSSKGLAEIDWDKVERIVNMTGIPGQSLFGNGRAIVDWEIDDPFGEDLGKYRAVAEEIEEKVRELAEELRAKKKSV